MSRSLHRAMAILAAAGGIVGGFLVFGRSSVEQACGVSQATEPVQTVTEPSGLSFPYTLPDSGIVVEGTVKYSGTYWEDGSGETVTEISGLMLYNPSQRMVDFGAICLEQDEKRLYFFVYCLPPGSRCLVLEKSRHPYSEQAVTVCRELTTRWDYQELHDEQVRYMGFGEQLTVVNHSAKQQRHVTLWYKRYDHDEGYYVGGVAYSAHLFRINPQEQRTLTPDHYDAANAKIVAIELNGA